MGSAAELWDLSDPASEISMRYEHALKTVLHLGVRVTYVGSIDDQVVPLDVSWYRGIARLPAASANRPT